MPKRDRWTLSEALLVGAAWWLPSLLLLALGSSLLHSLPHLHPTLRFYDVDSFLPVSFALLGVVLFAGSVVIFLVRKAKPEGFAKSISWACGTRVLGFASLAGLIFGAVYLLVRHLLFRYTYQQHTVEYVAAFLVLMVIAEPFLEEAYFRGILYIAIDDRFGRIWSGIMVTTLFALMHPQHFLTVLPASALFTGVRIYTGSVKASCGCHAAYNLSVLLLGLATGT